jgi:hypothetical protein
MSLLGRPRDRKRSQQHPSEIAINADVAFGVHGDDCLHPWHAGSRKRLSAKLHSHATRLDYCTEQRRWNGGYGITSLAFSPYLDCLMAIAKLSQFKSGYIAA